MAHIGLNITITGLSGELIIRWVKASLPLAEVGRTGPGDYPFPVNTVYDIIDLDPVVYTVQLWRSDDGVSLDQLIKDWSIDASQSEETAVEYYQYRVGRGSTEGTIGLGDYWIDPSAGDTILVDERLDGATQDELIVHEAGYGNHLNDEYDLHAGGGIELLGGKQFDDGVSWTIERIRQMVVTAPPGSGGSGSPYAGVEIISADRDFFVDPTDNLYNKLCIAAWAGTVGTITFPDLTLIPDGTHVTFNTHGGSQNYLALQFDAGDTVRFNNQLVNIIHLARCQAISLFFFAGVCYIKYEGNALQRGQVAWDYDGSRAADTAAYLLADEATGVLSNEDYPGLYAQITQMPGGTVPLGTAVGQWSYDSGGGVYPNKRYYGVDSGTFTFRVPHLSGMTAKAGSTPGLYQADNVGNFSGTLTVPKGHSYTGAPNVGRFGNGSSNPEDKTVTVSFVSAITETRVKSFGQIPYIIL